MQRALDDIWQGLRTRRLRTGLALLALTLGMTVLTAALAIIGGLRARAARLICDLGVQVFAVAAAREPGDLAPALTESDLDLLRANLPGSIVSGFTRFQTAVPGLDAPVTVLASDQDLCAARRWRLAGGRDLDERDCRHGERYALISEDLSRRLGCAPGQIVRLMNVPFTVVGVVATGGAAPGIAGAQPALAASACAVVPRGAARLWQTRPQAQQRRLDAIFVRVGAAQDMDRTVATAERVLAGPDRRPAAREWITPEALVRDLRRFQVRVALVAGGVGALCLGLGGITLMSLMIANVRERTGEIGLRRALGATPGDVAGLFLLEGCLLTGLAAALGAPAAIAVLRIAALFVTAPYELGAGAVLALILAALGLGAAFSWAPARLAARMAPAEALRSE